MNSNNLPVTREIVDELLRQLQAEDKAHAKTRKKLRNLQKQVQLMADVRDILECGL